MMVKADCPQFTFLRRYKHVPAVFPNIQNPVSYFIFQPLRASTQIQIHYKKPKYELVQAVTFF